MTAHSLQKIFAPASVAIIGASDRTGGVAHTVLQNLLVNNCNSRVFAVNPKHQTVAGLPCFPRIGDLPEPVDLAVICTPGSTVPGLVHECGEARVAGILILSAGFRELGAGGAELELQLQAAAQKFPGMRILGPNCLGFMAPHRGLNVSFVKDMPPRGSVAFVSQSGALCSAVLDWARQEEIGFSYFVSLGNMLDVGFDDLIDFLASDPWTESIVLYVESITKARRFMSAARGFTRSKPIVAYKAGRFSESAKAAASHTGAMAGVDSVYEAAMIRAGIVRVTEIDDLFDCAELLSMNKAVHGPRLAMVTNAGGPGVIATDSLLAHHGSLASLSAETVTALDSCLPRSWSRSNPVDIIGDAPPQRFYDATIHVLRDKQVDAVLVILSPQAMTDPTESARLVIAAAKDFRKPVLASWMGGATVREGMRLLTQAGIACFPSPERAVRAFTHLISHWRNRDMLYETPREVPFEFPLDYSKAQAAIEAISSQESKIVSESDSKSLLAAYDIPVTQTRIARNPNEAVDISRELGFPVVLKVFSPDITHKTEVGGVQLNLQNESDVAAAYDRILSSASAHRPEAHVEGVTVQRQIAVASGIELIVGAKQDPVFGSVLMVGMGGITAELLQDRALELPPLNDQLARHMLQSLRCWPLLQGYRGRPGANLDRLVEVLMRISYLVANHPEVVELDINPLLATPDEVIALDARIVLDATRSSHPTKAFSHLAIRPYPDEYARRVILKNGTELLFRPIKPEDEPLWHAHLQRCSAETLRERFRYMFKSTTHEMAARFCFIDYDRELAIVAERKEGSVHELVGVGRLVANSDHTDAEFAILVEDAWQGQGVGSQLTDYCLEICQTWGLRRVQAVTATTNRRMLNMLRHRGFCVKHDGGDTFAAVKELG